MADKKEGTAHTADQQARQGDCTTERGEPRDCTTGEVWEQLKPGPGEGLAPQTSGGNSTLPQQVRSNNQSPT